MTNKNDNLNTPNDADPPPNDQLDAMLRTWHEENAQQAALGRDRLVRALAEQAREEEYVFQLKSKQEEIARQSTTSRQSPFALLRNLAMNPYSRLAASLIILVALVTLFIPTPGSIAYAQAEIIMVPEGGKLEAHDEDGNLIGPCPLKHTDVNVEISGLFSRVTIKQTYQNPYQSKIEAQYTFPMSHRAAVDRMTMTVGDRVVIGEVKERKVAQQIYQAARAAGYVASLLEQERPNIFTQSVANIEPQAEIIIEISYVEVLESKDGEFTFDFPMVVGPRYIPGASMTSPAIVPAELTARHGIILRGPAKLTVGAAGDIEKLGSLQIGKLNTLLGSAQPIAYPGDTWWGKGDPTGGAIQPTVWYRFEAQYTDESIEFGQLYTDGTGEINGRWFYTDPAAIKDMGTGFSQNTNQVPDASRITPEPVRPPDERAGHNISLKVTIDTGGPGIVNLKSMQHKIDGGKFDNRLGEPPSKVTIALASDKEIPNRDFVLNWKTSSNAIQEAQLTHAGEDGGFFTLILQPPDRVDDADVGPRELVFVMDTSGSMRGFPIDKSKEVINKAIDSMRDGDTFNVITFAGSTSVLWSEPKPATADNRKAAQTFINSQAGRGGTEMMTAINAALIQKVNAKKRMLTPIDLANLPADGRSVIVVALIEGFISTDIQTIHVPVQDGLFVEAVTSSDFSIINHKLGETLRMTGTWDTRDGKRVLNVTNSILLSGEELEPTKPMRIVLFLTDGYVGNDMAIIDAVKNNAHTTRVFSFGIGNSVNRWLLQGMANAGRGEAEFVLLESDSDDAVSRFTKRIETPVLTDIKLAFSDGLEVTDVIPPLDAVPDLFDVKPLIIHGRYTKAGTGTLTIAGNTGAGRYERKVDLEFALDQKEHDVISTLWARAKVEQILNKDLRAAQENRFPADLTQQVVDLGEEFQIMTQFTSFVAVEKSRITVGGEPVLVAVPIEMPSGVSFEGVFGQMINDAVNGRDVFLGAKLSRLAGTDMDDSRELMRDQLKIARSTAGRRMSMIIESGVRSNVGVESHELSSLQKAYKQGSQNSYAGVATGAPVTQSERSLFIKSAQIVGKKGVASGESLGLKAGRRMRGRSANTPATAAEFGGSIGGGGIGGGAGNKAAGFRPDISSGGGDAFNFISPMVRKRINSIYGLSSRGIANKDVKGGNITFPWQQTKQLAGGPVGEDRAGFENTRTKFILSGKILLYDDLPTLDDAFFAKSDNEQLLSFSADLPFSKPEVDKRSAGDSIVGGQTNIYRELKDLSEKYKATDAEVKEDVPLVDASGATPASITKPETSQNEPARAVEIAEADDKDKIELKAEEALDSLEVHKKEQAEVQTSTEQIELPLLSHLFNRAGRPMLANEVAIIIGQFAANDELEVASQLTNELVEYLPDYEYGTKMRDTFKNEELDVEQKKQAVIEIATQAYNELNEILLNAYIEARLQNVLEDSLYQRLVVLPLDENRSEDRTARSDDENAVLVSVILTNRDDEVINSLKEVGLNIIAKPKGNSFVVGEIPADKIANLALLEAVKWIELAKITKQ